VGHERRRLARVEARLPRPPLREQLLPLRIELAVELLDELQLFG
jgi:hypothetical protein